MLHSQLVEAGVLEYCAQHLDIMTPLPHLLVAHDVKRADLAVETEIRLECISWHTIMLGDI